MITTTMEDVRAHLPELHKTDSKFDRGHLLVIAGSFGMAGAAIMCVKAAYRAGAGYVTAVIPNSIYPIFAVSCPEAVCVVYEEENLSGLFQQLEHILPRVNAVAFGPGLGKNREKIGEYVFSICEKPLLIDADGLTALAKYSGKLQSVQVVLTPHSGEAGRLLKSDHKSVDAAREEAVVQIAEKYHAVALLKGADTLVFQEGKQISVNPTGNPGMAKAGSGDVLSGVIGALLAEGLAPYEAARIGAYIHGAAGDIAAKKKGIRSMGPFDIIDGIGEVIHG